MKIGGTTRVLGIFGDPIDHSLSPVMQNEALARAGIDAVYVPFHIPAERLAAAVAAIRALGIRGVNLTVPHKEAVMAHLDEIDADARLIGAVNTVVNRQGLLVGYNTDGTGFLRSLVEDLQFEAQGRRILALGAGGACRAAVVALARAGAAWVGIANRTPERSEGLAREFSAVFSGTAFAHSGMDPGALTEAVNGVDLVVNTSAVGLKGESFENFPWSSLPGSACVYDMVYRRGGTPLVRQALELGHPAADGLGMLAAQGEEGFAMWTGQVPPSGVMKARLLAEYS